MSRPGPLLLDSLDAFPAPPTFIPVSPAAAHFNPPPSRPPAAPLPPVPGPSRISDTDTLLFLSGTDSARSRRSSKLSLRENRDSFASTRSDSLRSVSTRSSPQTPSSAAQSLLAFSIDEHAEPDEDDLLEGPPLRDLQKTPLDTLEDLDVPIPPLSGSSSFRRTPPRTATPRRESIALNSVAMPIPDSDTEPDFDALEDRAGSPDIAAILATTPRPRLNSLSRHTSGFDHEPPWEEDFIDDYGQVRGSVYSVASKASEGYAFGFPEEPDAQSVSSDNGHVVWDEPNDSDSDLDLHTSLPQLMLHQGFLSPRSKLLPNTAAPASLAPTPSPASTVFPNTDPLPRDTRDTPKRRVRHRDGKLLRGGIGLTTGLGWSDSEDEDAPSPLTRRISRLNLNRSQSQLGLSRASSFSRVPSSLGGSASVRSSTFSRSTSRLPSRRTQSEYTEDASTGVDEFGAIARGAAPPTSWTRRSEPPSRLSRAQSQTQLTRGPSIRTDDSAHTTASAGSTMSLPLMRSHSRVLRVMAADKEKPLPRTPLRRGPSDASVSGIRPRAATGVSASSLPRPQSRAASASVSLSMQSTPQPGGPAPSLPTSSVSHKPLMRPLRLQPRQAVIGGDRAPVPVPSVLHSPMPTEGLSTSQTASSLASSTSSSSGLSVSTSATSISLLSPSSSMSLLTPSSPIGSPSFPRAPSPYSRGPPSPGFPSMPGTPTTPMYEQGPGGMPLARPRPRTGTGMVYRTSTYGSGPARGLPVPRASAKAVAL
ncbi:hypothetical protein C8F04DRAFT_1175320 [Mycena alexandri]|uniref:Uncharacterized protein n=1 Tax=Mycena alexandri TaxID=1745969 RepID=A0AAD6TEB0_9AGAR|nr:hypothetical protein C8F04DRAFT_1175320 [Mycena alexandri]